MKMAEAKGTFSVHFLDCDKGGKQPVPACRMTAKWSQPEWRIQVRPIGLDVVMSMSKIVLGQEGECHVYNLNIQEIVSVHLISLQVGGFSYMIPKIPHNLKYFLQSNCRLG